MTSSDLTQHRGVGVTGYDRLAMIRHCVFIRFQPSVTDDMIALLMQEVADLRGRLPGIVQMHIGDNVSPELGMDKGFTRGFMIDFDSPENRDTYLAHPAHKAVGAKLVAAAVDGPEGIFVYDLAI